MRFDYLQEGIRDKIEEYDKRRDDISDLELMYDKKYNAFCLSVSDYNIDRLQSTLSKKIDELSKAKEEKKSAKDKYDRLKAQLKIDYIQNICTKCRQMIKKKSSYRTKHF